MAAKADSSHRRIVLGNDRKELDRLATFVQDVGRDDGLDERLIFAIALCLEEAFTNIIMYGGAGGHPSTQISVSVTPGNPLVACIEDDGEPFDPTTIPPLIATESLADAKIGGLGMHLMRQFASAMRYERKRGCNHLTFEFADRGGTSR
jgi:anti-sigma regulatory factor (Ser/Thr protein kinase)